MILNTFFFRLCRWIDTIFVTKRNLQLLPKMTSYGLTRCWYVTNVLHWVDFYIEDQHYISSASLSYDFVFLFVSHSIPYFLLSLLLNTNVLTLVHNCFHSHSLWADVLSEIFMFTYFTLTHVYHVEYFSLCEFQINNCAVFTLIIIYAKRIRIR